MLKASAWNDVVLRYRWLKFTVGARNSERSLAVGRMGGGDWIGRLQDLPNSGLTPAARLETEGEWEVEIG
jgi:hypothetical protein